MKCASELRAIRASAATSSGFSYERSILSRARSMRRLAASTRTTLATLARGGGSRRAILAPDWRRAAPRRRLVGMNLDALWHDLECGAYREDLPLWRALAAEAGGLVVDGGGGGGGGGPGPPRPRGGGGGVGGGGGPLRGARGPAPGPAPPAGAP